MYDYTHRLDKQLDRMIDDIPAEIKVVQMSETITEQNYTIASLRTEIAQLQRAIKELETEHRQRDRGFVYDRNANVRAGGEYQD